MRNVRVCMHEGEIALALLQSAERWRPIQWHGPSPENRPVTSSISLIRQKPLIPASRPHGVPRPNSSARESR